MRTLTKTFFGYSYSETYTERVDKGVQILVQPYTNAWQDNII